MEQEKCSLANHKLLEEKVDRLKELLQEEVVHLKELMQQHDKLSSLSIEKDITATYAKQKETAEALAGLRRSFDENIKSVTERNDSNVKTIHEKIDTLERHTISKMDAMKLALEDKRDTLYIGIQESFKNVQETINATKISLEEKRDTMIKGVDEKISANLAREIEKFAGIDKQMKITVDANAEVSNKAISSIRSDINTFNLRWEKQQGSLIVLNRIVSFLVAIVLAIVIFYVTRKL